MSRKDYEALAAAFRAAYQESQTTSEDEGVDIALDHVARALAADNPRFNRRRFTAAALGVPIENIQEVA